MRLNIFILKTFKVLIVFINFILAGCFAKYYELEHEPTKAFLKGVKKADIQSVGEFNSNGALFIPFFNKLTVSYPVPESYLRVYCLEECNVKVEVATLSNGLENYTMEVNKDVQFRAAKNGYFSGSIKLFDADNFDVKKLSVEEEFNLKVIVNVGGEMDELVFKLTFAKHLDIKWST